MRDIALEDTIYLRFTTRAFATGIPTTLAGTPVLSIYEENNLTQITAGVSVSVDYDSVTGLNQATIVATTGNGYEAGKSYDLVVTTGTVGGVSVVGEVVGSFTVGAVKAVADTALTDYGANTVVPDAAGVVPSASENRQEMDSNSTSLASILADTNELQADDIPGLIAALNNLSSSDILTSALTESYAADGATATLSQLLYMIWSMMNSLGFITLTGTSRKLDGSTPAMTFTIDDADNPTDINRET